MDMRLEYTKREEAEIRIAEIEAVLENNLYETADEEKELVEEHSELEYYLKT